MASANFVADDSAASVQLIDLSQRFERSKGLLLWDLPVQPGAGDKATTLRYSYALEFDKNMTLQDISGEQKTRLRTEFIESSKASIRK